MGDLVPQRPPKQQRSVLKPYEPPAPTPAPPPTYTGETQQQSILRQVSKYRMPPRTVNADIIQKKEPPYPVSESKVDRDTWTDILYPYRLLQAYHDVRVKGKMVTERQCDKLLFDFMDSVDKQKYIQQFKQAITNKIFRIIMARVLVATFFEDQNKSSMPKIYRKVALGYLGLQSASDDSAMRLLEEYNAFASHEEMILGRIGYLMIWQSGIRPDQLAPKNYRLEGGNEARSLDAGN